MDASSAAAVAAAVAASASQVASDDSDRRELAATTGHGSSLGGGGGSGGAATRYADPSKSSTLLLSSSPSSSSGGGRESSNRGWRQRQSDGVQALSSSSLYRGSSRGMTTDAMCLPPSPVRSHSSTSIAEVIDRDVRDVISEDDEDDDPEGDSYLGMVHDEDSADDDSDDEDDADDADYDSDDDGLASRTMTLETVSETPQWGRGARGTIDDTNVEPWAMDDDAGDGVFAEVDDADSAAALDGDRDADAIADADPMGTTDADAYADPMSTKGVDVDAPHEDDDVDGVAHMKHGKIFGGGMKKKLKAAQDGTTRVMGWTFDHVNKLSETSTSKKGLRPMHVRVSIRVHHVSFLHPGLDNGSRSTMSDGSILDRKLRNKSKNAVPDSGMLRFGSKKGNWTNPSTTKAMSFRGGGGSGGDGHLGGSNITSDNAAPTKKLRSGHKSVKHDTSEVAKIISAEAFRLSRDGIIQGHYALNHASPQSSTTLHDSADSRLNRTQADPMSSDQSLSSKDSSITRNDPHFPAMLSPYSSVNPQEAARYYMECAERPKGYRRLVVSSAMQTSDLPSPPPPSTNTSLSTNYVPSESALYKSKVPRTSRSQPPEPVTEKDKNKCSTNNGNLFDNVEYQYIGPPKTGPDFYRLLRQRGAATFGRYLPEVACSVPNHSILFEIARSSKKLKRKQCCASTQPFVVEAPHVVWGDARDKALSRIAREGCPLIDSRQFEYVSNARLDDAKFSDSLMVCGATLWVKNDDDDASSVLSTTSTLKQGLIKAEYYGGKLVDGAKVGVSKGVKGIVVTKKVALFGSNEIVKGTEAAFLTAEKGLHTTVKGAGLLPISECESVTSTITHTPSEARKLGKKKSSTKSLFNPPKMGNKLRRRKHNAGEGGQSISHDSGQVSDAAKRSVVEFDLASKEFKVLKPVPYVLLVDDIIHIRILSFPDKDDVIASFPISVASLMVQRSMDSRIDDPMKPSELTTSFIQEPSAHLLRWGVELKVTLRAVEVKPQVPRVIRTKLMIDDELDLIRSKLEGLGKNSDEIEQELQAKEELLMKEENELNLAIVHYGYGKGENDGVGQQEIRLRQMFYCDREQIAIARKIDRRNALNDNEKEIVNGAPDMQKNYDPEELQKLLKQLEDEFPVIDVATATAERALLASTVAATKSSSGFVTVQNSCTKASLALARSFDSCMGKLSERSTVVAVEQKVNDSSTGGPSATITKNEMKLWCSQIAKRLSANVRKASAADATVRSSIEKIQSIIAESALGPGASFAKEDDVNNTEEMKLDEDEIALSLSEKTDSSEQFRLLADWVDQVASQLQACAQELDDDEDLDSFVQERNTVGQPNRCPSLGSRANFSSNGTDQNHHIDQDDAPSALRKEEEPSAMSLFIVESRYRKASSISTLKDALPKSKLDRKFNIESLLMAKEQFHVQDLSENQKEVHPRPGKTASFATTLAFFALFVALLAGAAAVLDYSWPVGQGQYFNLEEGHLHQLWDQARHLALRSN